MGGIDILKHVAENKRTEAVILITAFGSLDSAAEALSYGVFDYIVKPFKKEQIIFAVERAVRWQKLKSKATTLDSLFEAPAWPDAQVAFREAYVRHRFEQLGDAEAVARETGIELQVVREVIGRS
jgi:DNA-binding NtrC family response regulator